LGPSAAARTDLERLEKSPLLEIEHLGRCHFGKYPWEVATWEKSFGKVPNIS